MQGRRYFIVLDNCRVHRTREVDAWSRHTTVRLVFNAPYNPETNAIEYFWSVSKRIFKVYGTRSLLRGQRRRLEQEARDSIDSVTDAMTVKCANEGLRRIRKIVLPGTEND